MLIGVLRWTDSKAKPVKRVLLELFLNYFTIFLKLNNNVFLIQSIRGVLRCKKYHIFGEKSFDAMPIA